MSPDFYLPQLPGKLPGKQLSQLAATCRPLKGASSAGKLPGRVAMGAVGEISIRDTSLSSRKWARHEDAECTRFKVEVRGHPISGRETRSEGNVARTRRVIPDDSGSIRGRCSSGRTCSRIEGDRFHRGSNGSADLGAHACINAAATHSTERDSVTAERVSAGFFEVTP